MLRLLSSLLIASNPATQYSVCSVSNETPTVSCLAAGVVGPSDWGLPQPISRTAKNAGIDRSIFMQKVVSDTRCFALPTHLRGQQFVRFAAPAESTAQVS